MSNEQQQKELKFHEQLLDHLQNTHSCKDCENDCACARLKEKLAELGPEKFLQTAMEGSLPLLLQEAYDQKLFTFIEKE